MGGGGGNDKFVYGDVLSVQDTDDAANVLNDKFSALKLRNRAQDDGGTETNASNYVYYHTQQDAHNVSDLQKNYYGFCGSAEYGCASSCAMYGNNSGEWFGWRTVST